MPPSAESWKRARRRPMRGIVKSALLPFESELDQAADALICLPCRATSNPSSEANRCKECRSHPILRIIRQLVHSERHRDRSCCDLRQHSYHHTANAKTPCGERLSFRFCLQPSLTRQPLRSEAFVVCLELWFRLSVRYRLPRRQRIEGLRSASSATCARRIQVCGHYLAFAASDD